MDDYDIIADALKKHRDRLWDMLNRNMNSEYVTLNIMDDIRFYQIERLDAAIAARKNNKEWQGLTDKPTKIFCPNLKEMLNSAGFYQKKEWEGLTDEERHKCWSGIDHKTCISHTRAYVDAIEAKLKEKNT